MRIVCISDTHGFHARMKPLPEGDVLVHAGDLTAYGNAQEIVHFNEWLGKLFFKHKVVVAGNHDRHLAEATDQECRILLSNAHYLEDSSVEIDGIHFYGSPWTPEFNNWYFMLPRGGQRIRNKWRRIPSSTDVLITHGPPAGKGDYSKQGMPYIGCDFLREAVLKVQPMAHVFGHNHEGHGAIMGEFTTFINASICNRNHWPMQEPIVFDTDDLQVS